MEEKDGLCEDEKTAGVEERVGREEDERLEKYAGPDGGCEEDDAADAAGGGEPGPPPKTCAKVPGGAREVFGRPRAEGMISGG